MKVDLYVKAVLTVIAVCLVWLCLGKVELVPEAEAQLSSNSVGRYQLFNVDEPTVLIDTVKGRIYSPEGGKRYIISIE